MPPRKGNRGKQDWLDLSSDEDANGAGSSGGQKNSGKPGEWGGNKRRVHGLDRKLAAAETTSTSHGKLPAFTLRDTPVSDVRNAASAGTHDDVRQFSPDANADTATLFAMFGAAFPDDTIEDVYRTCGRSVQAAADALLGLTTGDSQPSGAGFPASETETETEIETEKAQPQNETDSNVDLWDALPGELRLLVLDHLGPRDAGRAARSCRDFATTVRNWRATKLHVAPPPTLTLDGVCSLVSAYPNLNSVSLKRCVYVENKPAGSRGCVRDVHDVFRVLRAASAGPAGHTITSIDLEACDVRDGDVAAVLELFQKHEDGKLVFLISELKLGKCALVTDKALVQLATHPAGLVLRSLSVAGTQVTSSGARIVLGGRAAGGLPNLESFDFSGCVAAKGSIALPPLLTIKSLRALYLPGITAVTVQLPKDSNLLSMHISQCVSLSALHVSAGSLRKLNASQCKNLTLLEMHCAGLTSLNLQHCVSLTSPLTFVCPQLTELNVSGCVTLQTHALRAMAAAARQSLECVKCGGCVSMQGELVFSSRVLARIIVDGCARVTGLRVAAPVQKLSARRCKNLAVVWIDPVPEREEGEEPGVEEPPGLTWLKLDLRNCVALRRLVGLRSRALEGKLAIDLAGCDSLPDSERPTVR
jgi:hypothetical protein